MGDHHESPYGEGAETTQRTRLLYRGGRTDSERTVDFPGCRPDHPALQQRQSWSSELLPLCRQLETMFSHPVYPQILAGKDAGAEIQNLCPTGFPALWKRPLTAHQRARKKGGPPGLFLSQPRLDKKPTGLSRRKSGRYG